MNRHRRMILFGNKAAAATAYGYDDIVNLVHAYEIGRRAVTSYTGDLVLLRRASDNAELAFTYDSDGNLDTTAIAAWAGGASYVVTAYDQIGSDDITQATGANQPLFTASAQNGHAGMTFDGTNDYLQGAFTNGGALSQPVSVYLVMQLDASEVDDNGYNMAMDSDDATNRLMAYKDNDGPPDHFAVYAGALLSGNAADSNMNIWSILFNGASSQFWHNDVSQVSGDAGAHNADGLTIGANFSGGNNWKGIITSAIITDPAHSTAQREAMQTAMNAYWAAY